MVKLVLILFLVSAVPGLLAALALKSALIAGLTLGSSFFFTMYLRFSAYSEFISSLGPLEGGGSREQRLLLLWQEVQGKREKAPRAEFRVYRSAAREFQGWVKSRTSLQFFVSRGFLETVDEEALRRGFQSWNEARVRETARANFLRSLELRFERWKGSPREFRYWFCSFWFYPLERMLKIAKI